MYSGRGFRESEIGDIDVIVEQGVYHLFHLILPNHDYIAHAVSEDGIHWKRTRNALFVGDPGTWDDDMLWTMNVSRYQNHFQMFYTGLSQEEKGFYQRIGRAYSKDLIEWTKDVDGRFPMEPIGPHYETPKDNVRQWVSFRDPYFFKRGDEEFILFCSRIATGSISRRGCVGLSRLHGDHCELLRPLFIPYVYDDVECPCLFELGGQFYLLGSIREDVKVHYWHADRFDGEYRAFHNNVLMPEGNYAARVCQDGEHLLVYAFYVNGPDVETAKRFLPPPKEVVVAESGRLVLKSFWRWSEKETHSLVQKDFPDFIPLLHNPSALVKRENDSLTLECSSGYEAMAMVQPADNWVWEGRLDITGLGKCGLVFDCDEQGNGYYVSLDCVQGLVQIRSWGSNPGNIYMDYQYLNLQTNVFKPNPKLQYSFKLIRYGHYVELSIDGEVKLSLVDERYLGDRLGVYAESAEVVLRESRISALS